MYLSILIKTIIIIIIIIMLIIVTCDYPIKGTKLFAGDIFQWQDSLNYY